MNLVAYHILNDHFGIPSVDAKIISRGMAIQRIEKHGFFQQHNDPADHVGYVVSGSFIGFRKEGESNAFLIVPPNGWLGDIVAFHKKLPSYKSIMALEESEVLVINRSYHEAMLTENKSYPRAFIHGLVETIEKFEEKLMIIQENNLEKQIRYLKNKLPEMFQRGKQKYLAKFLDITPEAFSRNLKKLNLSDDI